MFGSTIKKEDLAIPTTFGYLEKKKKNQAYTVAQSCIFMHIYCIDVDWNE